MAKSPFYKIQLDKGSRDVTEIISSIDYEDCTDEDDLITLKVQGAPISVIDEDWFNIGATFTFIYGFIGGTQSAKRKGQISTIDFDYDSSWVNITVKARDLGAVSKKLTSTYVYKDKTASEIAIDIANKLGLTADVQTTQTKYANYPMAGKTYSQILKELCISEGTKSSDAKGVWQYYVRGDILTFKQRDLSAKSERLFEYKNGDGIIKDVSVTYEDSNDGGSTSVSSAGVDIATGKPFKSEAKAADNKEAATGGGRLDFDVNANLLAKKQSPTAEKDSGKVMNAPTLNKADADLKTGAMQKSKAAQIMKLSFSLELDPTISSGQIITVSGMAQKHSGNWIINKTIHTVSSGGGATAIECYRNGAKKSPTATGGTSGGTVNKSQGNKTGETKQDIRVFDENSKRLK